MPPRARGLYESLVTEALDASLRALGEPLSAHQDALRPAEAADRLALHVGQALRRAVHDLPDDVRVARGVELARKLVAAIDSVVAHADPSGESPVEPGAVLRAILGKLPDGSVERIAEPLLPLLDTALLTNAPGEPRVGSQILTEIGSSDRIDLVMAFIRRTGILPLLPALRRHSEAGRALRVLTTTYTGSTEAAALDELLEAGAHVRVSYDVSTTRLHAKAWLFHRSSGFSTAYIGSSNLTHSAQIAGMEWNVRVSGPRNPDVVEKVSAVFNAYWESGDFVPYDRATFERETSRPATVAFTLPPTELRLEPFQERLLERIELSRARGHHRNLLVSATGTGKTVMAAVDYARLRTTLPRARLLFVAHRQEILEQSLATFRFALRDPAFGELWVGGKRPSAYDHVFASIQSLSATGYANLDRQHFDVVIVDEFHHAAMDTYQGLLQHARPVELLGLTATPERADGRPILEWFEGRIAAELRLWDAIDQHRLAPFAYYGVSDGLDLTDIPWRRGRGYDVEKLTNLYTSDEAWARLVVRQVAEHVDDPRRMRALGFCVSVSHARFMARVFSEAGIAAVAIWADSPEDDRKAALTDLAAGRVQAVFSVDLFNEGVDVPVVDTVLLLRPTESPTLFLQQLGRGLRKSVGKTVCTVLDFVGQHRKEFRFDRRFRALLGGSRKDLVDQIEGKFPFLPAGCHMELDAVAQAAVLANIRDAVPSRWTAKVEELRHMAAATTDAVTLGGYLEATGLELEDVYTANKSWSDLRADAGLPVAPAGPNEEILRRACGRVLHVNDAERLDTYRRLLTSAAPPAPSELSERELRLLRMLFASIAEKAIDKTTTMPRLLELVWAHPQVRVELLELFDVLADQVDHVHTPLRTYPDVPLLVHARYSRIEILAAFGLGEQAKVAPWQTGVYWAEGAKADLLAFTLDKTTGQFSPTTRYRDYAISPDLIHWESQGVTRADSPTGRRYQLHSKLGTSVLLFARLRSDDRAFWLLGPATYVSHESEQPMAITWRLEHPLSGDLFAAFAAAVA